MEIVGKVKDTFLKIKGIIYSGTNFKNLYTKFTNSSWNRYIRYIFSSEIFR